MSRLPDLRFSRGLATSGRPSVLAILAVLAFSGCRHREAPAPAAEAPVIPVAHPVAREIADYVYYTGRTDAVSTAQIRARVTGYLTQMPFREGAEVKAGDLLFEIDPRPYQAKVDAARAALDQKDAAYRLARAENARSKAIDRNVAGSISPEALQQSQTAENQALADYNSARANLDSAQLDLGFTKVASPIDGQVGRYLLTVGNLVNQDQTLLTTVVSVDPMYAYFDMDERTILRIRKLINQGKVKPRGPNNEIPVYMGLEGDEGYPHKGVINFANNALTTSTGTLTVRGVFANPKPEVGIRLLTPGMFVRIQFPVGPPHPALLVADRAIGSDQGMKFVYVVDADRKVQYRRIRPGAPQDDGLRAVDEGLKPDDWVVVGGLQQLRPRMTVETEVATMPAIDEPAERVDPAAKSADTPTPKAGPAPTGPPTSAPDAKTPSPPASKAEPAETSPSRPDPTPKP